MKIEVETFYEMCRIADLPLTRTELIIMDAVEGDRDKFLRVCEDYAIPITKNERFFLEWTPTPEDDNMTALEKVNHMVIEAKKIFKRSKHGV